MDLLELCLRRQEEVRAQDGIPDEDPTLQGLLARLATEPGYFGQLACWCLTVHGHERVGAPVFPPFERVEDLGPMPVAIAEGYSTDLGQRVREQLLHDGFTCIGGGLEARGWLRFCWSQRYRVSDLERDHALGCLRRHFGDELRQGVLTTSIGFEGFRLQASVVAASRGG